MTFSHDPVLGAPHCPNCHTKFVTTAMHAHHKKLHVYECKDCNTQFSASEAMIIEKYRYGV